MTTVIWESDNSFENGDMFVIFSGTAAISPLFSGGGERLFSDDRFVYKQGISIIRITHGSGITVASGTGDFSGETNFEKIDITPASPPAPLIGRWIITHFLDDFANALGTAAVSTNILHSAGPTELFTSIYPELGFWSTQSGYPDNAVQDLVGPDYPESPRIVVAFKDDPVDKIIVQTISGLASINLNPLVPTNWSLLLNPSGIVTDLEIVRII